MHRLTSAKKLTYTLLLASLVFSGLAFVVSPPRAFATKAVEKCDLVVEKSACKKEVKKKCSGTQPERREDCEKAVVDQGKYHAVYSACRDRQNPQKCHSEVKKDCKGKSGQDLADCKSRVAKKGTKARANEASAFIDESDKKFVCGNTENAVKTRFDFGCIGDTIDPDEEKIGPIEDLAYAIIRFLSVGVGLVLVGSMIYAGIQYSSSEGSPEAASAAKKRIQNAIIGLILYLFLFALVQFLVPGKLFA